MENVRREYVAGRKRVVLQMPTGSGKTKLAGEMIRQAISKGRRVLFITDMLTLLDQTSNVFDEIGLSHGIVQGYNYRYNPDLPLQVCSIQTLARRRIPDADLIIIDEVHCFHKAHEKLMESLPNAYVLGLSATPWKKGLGKHFDSLIVGATVQELIDGGFLVDTTVYAPVNPDLKNVKVVGGDYVQKSLAQAVDTIVLNGQIVEHWLKLAEGRQTIVFAVNVAHSKHIAASFVEAGVRAAHIDGYMTSPQDKMKRRQIIENFKSGDIQILCSVGVTSKGFDYPGASCVVFARPTKSKMLYIQMAGRGIRAFEGKLDCLILDHAGNTARHGFITDPLPDYLDDGKKKENNGSDKDRGDPLPKSCPKCFFMKPPKTLICPKCGFKPEPKSDIEYTDEELVKVKSVKYTKEQRQQFYSELIKYQRSRNYSDGWTANKYRKKFGVWPKLLVKIAADMISPDTMAFINKDLDAYKVRMSMNRF
jgi:DNA repair protein RadD